MSRLAYLKAVLLALSIAAAHAQTPAPTPPATTTSATTESEDAKALNLLYGDFDAPDLTAPTLLGLATSQVSKPSNIKAVATSLAGAAASFPRVGRGLGLEIAPIQFFRRSAWGNGKTRTLANSLEQYASFWNSLGRNLTVSGAQAVDDKQARVALGAALVLFDGTDPLRDVAYVNNVSAELHAQQVQAKVQEQLSFNTRVADRLMLFVDSAGIYPNHGGYYTGLPIDQAAARSRLTQLYALLGGIGRLPSIPPSRPLQTAARFSHVQDSLVTALLPGLAAQPLYTPAQQLAIAAKARQLAKEVKAYFPTYAAVVQQVYTTTNAVVKKAKEHFEKLRWNATIVQVGGGTTWASADQQYATASPEASSYFGRAAIRPYIGTVDPGADQLPFFYQHVQVVLGVRYDTYRSTPATKTPKTAADTLDNRLWYGARLLIGGAYLRLSGEFAMQHLTYRPEATLKQAVPATILYSSTIGVEVRLTDKVWAEAAIGSTQPAGQAARLLTFGSLKYALRNSQRFKTP